LESSVPAIPNTNDASGRAPRLRIGLSLITLLQLPPWSAGPRGSTSEVLAALKDAGFEAVQTRDAAAAHAAGLVPTAAARVDAPADALRVARHGLDQGYDCTTLHVGTGFESDDEARALMEAILDASARTGHPLLVETHRATVTQDMKRTLDLAAAFPELRFNGDFAHWYTGLEMTYGDLEMKLARMAPVLERTRFLHGRVSDPGCIQIPPGAEASAKHVAFFRRMWTASLKGFLASAAPGDVFGFYPELLPASLCYARQVPDTSGALTEESDRWLDALALVRIARQCWAEANAS
jgi:hypothetical protein